jgi:hypothetical protein
VHHAAQSSVFSEVAKKGAFMKGLLVTSVAIAVFIFSCTKTLSVAGGGGDDFPNSHTTASALGKSIADNLSSSNQWGDSIVLPQSPLASLATQSVSVPSVPASSPPALAKKTAASQSLTYDFSDTLLGVVRVYYSETTDSTIKSDTIILLYDAAFRDTSVKNKHLYAYEGQTFNLLSHIRTYYRYADSDGDSIINNQNGKPNSVIAQTTVINLLGTVEKTVFGADGGTDENLDTKADNRLLAFNYVKHSATGDTVSFAQYESYSGAAFIIDPTRTDSSLVILRSVDTDLLQHKTATEAIFVIFPTDSAKTYPVYLRSVKSFGNGKTVTSLIRGARPDSLFHGSDTAWARIIANSPNDVVVADTLQYGVLLGADPADSSSTTLLSIRRHTLQRIGDERESIFSVTSDKPLAHNQALQSGTLSDTLNYSDGGWIHVNGTIAPDRISAVYTDSKGNTLNLAWDRSGTVVK